MATATPEAGKRYWLVHCESLRVDSSGGATFAVRIRDEAEGHRG
jgi:hypothetical protein